MKTIAIITARGGSKRIPRKNIRDFCGRPMLAYPIEAALSSRLFDMVMVSTDDAEIAETAKKYGAQVPFMRSEKNANDYATTTDVLLEVIDTLEEHGASFDVGCCLYPTAPFVTAGALSEALTRFIDTDAESLASVVRYSHPVERAMREADGRLVFLHPEHLNTRSQDLAPSFHDAGQFYFFRPEALRKNRGLLVGDVACFELPETAVQDIDSEADWALAELKYRLMTEARK